MLDSAFIKKQEIEKVKNAHPFTAELTLTEYICDVRRRISEVTGKPASEITFDEIYQGIMDDDYICEFIKI